MVQLLWNFLIRLNIYLPYDQETTSPNIHPRETKRYVLKKTCIRIFIATWFIVVPNLKQHKNLSIVEWERKLQYYDGKKKRMLYLQKQQHRWMSKTLYSTKEGRHKSSIPFIWRFKNSQN